MRQGEEMGQCRRPGLPERQQDLHHLSLSRESRILWNEVSTFKDDNLKFAWITNSGKVFLRKIEGHAPVLDSEVSDLDKLNSVYNAELFPDGYQVYRRDRCQMQTGKSRGEECL
ncbi:hypothetical protein J6590_071757 [Homalodisca vitripennis]|nr:hypothetical protein J6590_071757 [Homalodisca vitripennis]